MMVRYVFIFIVEKKNCPPSFRNVVFLCSLPLITVFAQLSNSKSKMRNFLLKKCHISFHGNELNPLLQPFLFLSLIELCNIDQNKNMNTCVKLIVTRTEDNLKHWLNKF